MQSLAGYPGIFPNYSIRDCCFVHAYQSTVNE